MFNLVFKDLIIQKKTLIFSVIYALVFILAFQFYNSPGIVFTMVPLFIAYMLLMGACGYDDKNKCDIMLNSLPINRIDLVISKYLSTLVFMFIGVILTFLISTVLNLFGLSHLNRTINIEDILGFSISIIILSSFYFPVYFKLGYQKSRYVNISVFMLFLIVPSILSKIIVKGSTPPSFILYLNSQPDWLISSFIIVIAIIVLLISMLLSIKLYINKDL